MTVRPLITHYVSDFINLTLIKLTFESGIFNEIQLYLDWLLIPLLLSKLSAPYRIRSCWER